MKPRSLNLFMKKFTRERVVPIISASVSCDTLGTARIGMSCLPYRASSNSAREPLLARVEELIDQILLDSNVSRQHVGNETIRHRRLFVEEVRHPLFGHRHDH